VSNMVGKTAVKSKSTASTIVVPFFILGLDKIFCLEASCT
jgi:hypothetical protein